MFSPPADRALRRVVADMARASAEDIAEIVAQLDPAQRRKVEDLLAAHRGVGPALQPGKTEPADFEGMSLWLVTRLTDNGASRECGLGHGMTATAAAALKDAAMAFKQAGSTATKSRAPRLPASAQHLHDSFMAVRGRP